MGKEETTVFWLKFLAGEIDISVLKTRRQENIVPDGYVMLLKLKKKKQNKTPRTRKLVFAGSLSLK